MKNGTSSFYFSSCEKRNTKKGDAMSIKVKNITELLNDQPLESLSIDEIARIGAQQMIKQALVAEFQAYLEQHKDTLIEGKPAVVKNGYHKERNITVGSGQVAVKVPRSRTRKEDIDEFSSAIVPKYIRRSLKIEEAIPLLYLRGISTNNMYPALEKLLGADVSGLSASNVSKLKNCWKGEYNKWKSRSLADTKYCYLWVDGIHTSVRFSDDRLCILVVIGAREDGVKELVAVNSGYRESTESWSELLRDLKNRGMSAPNLAIGDGALGFWAALRNVFPASKEQRCWVHKSKNVLDKLPKSLQDKARTRINEIYMSDKKETAEKAFNSFVKMYEDKYPKAVECLEKDKDQLLSFYDFPARHWKHIRTTNPIESTFSTVRLRTKSTRGMGSTETTFMMIFKLLEMATERWQKMWGYKWIPLVIEGKKFKDGELENKEEREKYRDVA